MQIRIFNSNHYFIGLPQPVLSGLFVDRKI